MCLFDGRKIKSYLDEVMPKYNETKCRYRLYQLNFLLINFSRVFILILRITVEPLSSTYINVLSVTTPLATCNYKKI